MQRRAPDTDNVCELCTVDHSLHRATLKWHIQLKLLYNTMSIHTLHKALLKRGWIKQYSTTFLD